MRFYSRAARPRVELRFDRDYLARFTLDPKRQLIGSMCSGALFARRASDYSKEKAGHHLSHGGAAPFATRGVDVVDEPFVREGNIAHRGQHASQASISPGGSSRPSSAKAARDAAPRGGSTRRSRSRADHSCLPPLARSETRATRGSGAVHIANSHAPRGPPCATASKPSAMSVASERR